MVFSQFSVQHSYSQFEMVAGTDHYTKFIEGFELNWRQKEFYGTLSFKFSYNNNV